MKKLIFTLGVFCIFFTARADVSLPEIISDNMVLQRNEPVRIWGWGDKNEHVTVEFNSQKKSVKTNKEGQWELFLDPMQAGGPFEMQISGKNDIALSNILIGEVWICSGQSNMEWPMSKVNNSEEEISNAKFSQIRILDVPHNLQFKPVNDIPETSWSEVSPESIKSFSAVGYFFGKNLYENINVPIGLIESSWGGTVVETWTSLEAIKTIDDFNDKVEKLKAIDEEKLKEEQKALKQKIRSMVKDGAGGLVNGKAVWADINLDERDWSEAKLPGLWENDYLPFVDGIVWYRKTITLTEEQTKENLTLSLGKIDDSDKTYFNGNLVGEMKNSYDKNRVYTISANLLKTGKNLITVRVEDAGGGGGLYGKPEEMKLTGKNVNISLSGMWKYKLSPVNLKFSSSTMSPNAMPTLLYNGMIHPIKKYTIKGAIWYQGESNASRAYQYRTIFPLMIKDWRAQFENEDLVFLFVQLANFMQEDQMPKESAWAELREAQTKTLDLPNTGMAVIIDIGEANDIHPRNKQDVGYRLSLPARHIAYGENIEFSGPMYKSMKNEDGKIRISFQHIGKGLKVKNKFGYLMGFQIAGSDKKFYWAKAELDGDDVIVHSDQVTDPVAVRYAWGNNPSQANFYNKEGLPASPFRTDDWKGITD